MLNIFKKKTRNLNKKELMELIEFNRTVNQKKFEAMQIEKNTVRIPDGKHLAKQTRAVADLYHELLANYISQTLLACGFSPGQPCTIDFESGKIVAVGKPVAQPPSDVSIIAKAALGNQPVDKKA